MAADISTSISDWSTTASSNQPDNSDAVGPNILAENQRAIQACVRTIYNNLRDSAPQWLTSVSGADTITASASAPAPAAYADGQTWRFVSAGANTGAATLNISSIGAKSITKNGTTALAAGDIPSGAVVEVTYDGTQFQLINVKSISDYALPLEYAPIIINHDGMINQRAATSNADDTYGFDRWNVLTQTGAVAESQITDVSDGTPYMMRTTQSQASAQRFGKCQILEAANSKRLRGKTITVGVKHKISSNANIRVAILEWTSTADSVTSDVVNDWTSGTYTAGNFFLAANLTVTSVSSAIASTGSLATGVITATVGSSCNNLIIFAWTEGTAAQNVTLDLAIDVKVGTYSSSAFPFSARSVGQELALCQRYYHRIFPAAVNSPLQPSATSQTSTAAQSVYAFPVQMRVAPSSLEQSGTANQYALTMAATTTQCSSVPAFAAATTEFATTNWTVASGLTAGQSGHVRTDATNGASAYLGWSAEL